MELVVLEWETDSWFEKEGQKGKRAKERFVFR